MDGSDKLEIQRLWTVEKVNALSHSIPTDHDITRWPHLQDIELPSIEETKVELIVGCNVPEAFWVLEEKCGNRGDPWRYSFTAGMDTDRPHGQNGMQEKPLLGELHEDSKC